MGRASGLRAATRKLRRAVGRLDLAGSQALQDAISAMESLELDYDKPGEADDWEAILAAHKAPEILTAQWFPLFRHAVQHELWSSLARFIVTVAGRRSGKTIRAKRKIVARALAFAGHADGRFLAAAPTREQAREIFWEDLKRLIPPAFVLNVSESRLAIQLVNGASLGVAGLDKPQRVEGSPLDGIIVDEYGDCKPETWAQHIRPALSTPGRPGWAWLFGVPRGGRHFRALYEGAQRSDDPDWQACWWPSSDILSGAEIEAAKASPGMDPMTYAAEYEASFQTSQSRVYYAFERSVHVEPQEYDPERVLIFCFDFNVKPGSAVVCQEQRYTGGRRDMAKSYTAVLDEVHIADGSTTPKVCRQLIREWGPHPGLVRCYGDPAGGARGTAKVDGSDWDIIRAMMRKAFPGRVVVKLSKGAPPVRSRTSAVNARFRTADDKVHCLVDPACERLIIDLEDIVPDDEGHPIKEKANAGLDHWSDAFGYYIEKVHSLHRPRIVERPLWG